MMKFHFLYRFRLRRLIKKIDKLIEDEKNPYNLSKGLLSLSAKLVALTNKYDDENNLSLMKMSDLSLSSNYYKSFDILDDIAIMTTYLITDKSIPKTFKRKRLNEPTIMSVNRFFTYNDRFVLRQTTTLFNVAIMTIIKDIEEYADMNSLSEQYLRGYGSIMSAIVGVWLSLRVPYSVISESNLYEVSE